ncbi:hypothetical protein [uncultured Chloroflexus sp.]|uniref:hypothetical protein n=1 Tax=uncultured Chloroflexus sp. TaxID=214040 RepID=UPI002635363B|nr:hypothetical protein [uncultured Chloroflexus sp.]
MANPFYYWIPRGKRRAQGGQWQHLLVQTDSTLVALTTAIQAVDDSVDETRPLIDTQANVTTRESRTITSSQPALRSAQASSHH